MISKEVTDEAAVTSCVKFADDHRMLVEPACGSVLSSVYTGLLADILTTMGPGPVVILVCGGNIVNSELVEQWRQRLNL